MPRLSDMQCQPCTAGTPPLKGPAIARLLEQLDDWQVVNEHHLTKEFRFADFAGALAFVTRVGQLAEQQGHHPDIHLGWGRARIETWTHSIGGLSEADFILAAHIDALPHSGP